MINVGGYAFGNGRYTQNYGPDAGADLVPWFGGVYTRLDLTLADNWDFSIRYNNDSFFDSTGYVRLTYRMGGSRRRNVPDQMEQPMMRNEHIVRAHETPLVALNPQNGNGPWQVVHVDSSALPGGDGTAESPFQTLVAAEGSALVTGNQWAITYVRPGNSAASGSVPINPYTDSFTVQQPNQFLIGSGGPLTIATQPVGGSRLLTIPALTSTNPVLSNSDPTDANGASIVIANGNGGATIANLQTLGSTIGLDASGNLSSGTAQPVGTTANPFGTPLATAGGSAVRNVTIQGDGTSAIQRGVRIAGVLDGTGTAVIAGTTPTGNVEFSETQIENTTSVAFQVGTFDTTVLPPTPILGSGGNANVDYHGSITNNIADNGNFSSVLVGILGTSGGTINLAATAAPPGATVPNQILDVGGQGILIASNNDPATPPSPGITTINIGNTTLADTAPTAIAVVNDYATTSITAVATPDYAYGITKSAGDATIGIVGGGPTFTFLGTINNASSAVPNGPIIGIRDVTNGEINISGPGLGPLLSSAGNVDIQNTDGSPVSITGLDLRGTNATGISVDAGSTGSTFSFTETLIANATDYGIDLAANNSTYTFVDTTISLDTALGGIRTNATGAMTFSNLNVTMDTGTSFIASAGAGDITINGTNSLVNSSTTDPAISASATSVDMTFNAITSGVDNATGIAADFTGTGSGTFTVIDAFTVGGAAGTAANNVTAGAVVVSVP